MSEMKTTEDRIGRAPDGSGSHLSDHAAARHGRSGFDPSRVALLPIDDDARSYNDSVLPSVMIWAGGDAYEDLVERNALPAIDPRSLDLDPWAIAVGVYRAMTEAAGRALCARDQRAKREDGDSRPRPEAASPITEGEVPVNSVLLSALKAMDEALTKVWPNGPGHYPQSEDVVTEAWTQIRSAITQADGR